MQTLNILFITSTSTDEPLGIMHLSAILKQKGHNIRGVIIDGQDELENVLKDFKPQIIGYSVIIGSEKKCIQVNQQLKERFTFFSIFGGPYPTFYPEILQDKSLDAICIGEGEEAMAELAQRLANNLPISEIKNIWLKNYGVIKKNAPRPLLNNLDRLPFPDREIFKNSKDGGAYNIISMRGCPFGCTYCFNDQLHSLYGTKSVRSRSIANLIEELKLIKQKNKPKIFLFHDDLFILNKRRVFEFTESYASEIGIPFTCSARPELMTGDIASALSQAGCRTVYVGIESGSEVIRKRILGRNISDRDILNACALINKSGMSVIGQNMVGIPTTGIDDDLKTLMLNLKCQVYYAWCSICSPYPRTKLEAIAREAQQLPRDYPLSVGNYHYKTFLLFPHANKVNALHKLFALGTSHRELLPSIKEILNRSDETDIEKLDKLSLSYRRYIYRKMSTDEYEPLPQSVNDFLADPVGFSLKE